MVTEETRRQANIRLLQRTCSVHITNILVSATHVVLYEYRDGAWHKSGMEGCLFLAERLEPVPTFTTTIAPTTTITTHQQQQQQQYQQPPPSPIPELIILNRHAPDNFQMILEADALIQHQEPYLIFKQGRDTIRGIWFHNAKERVQFNQVLQQTIQALKGLKQQQQQLQQQQTPATFSHHPHHNLVDATTQSTTQTTTTTTTGSTSATASHTMSGGTDTTHHHHHHHHNIEEGMATLATVFANATQRYTDTGGSSAGGVSSSQGKLKVQNDNIQNNINNDNNNNNNNEEQELPSENHSIPTPVVSGGKGGSSTTTTTTTTTNATNHLPGVALDKKSLQLALLSLVQDDRFLDLLHSQYLRVVHARRNKREQEEER